jgi:hypothetical protein
VPIPKQGEGVKSKPTTRVAQDNGKKETHQASSERQALEGEVRRLEERIRQLQAEQMSLSERLRELQVRLTQIRSQEDEKKFVLRIYPASDLVGKDQGTSIITLIRRLVERESWAGQGGRGSIEYFAPRMILIVRQSPEVHDQVATFLETLRQSKPAEKGGP